MITSKDLRSIDRVYFDFIEATPFYLVLRSKNTGHFWHLLEQDYKCFRSFSIFHKHHETDEKYTQLSFFSSEESIAFSKLIFIKPFNGASI